MPDFDVREVSYPTEFPHRRLHANNYYEDYVIDHWPRQDSVVLAILLRERTDARWKALGEMLTRELLGLGRDAGLSFNGDPYAAGKLAQVAQALWENADEQSRFALEMNRCPHPTAPERLPTSTEVTWTSMHRITPALWLPSLWAHTESNWFDYGCLLLLTVYGTDMASRPAPEDELNMEVFGRTLAHAVSWLAPVDGNIGFSVGMPRRSAMYEQLVNPNET